MTRVVTVASIAHNIRAGIHFDDLQWERSYNRVAAYGQSKLANLMFTYELQRRLAAKGAPTIAVAAPAGVTVNAIAPGPIHTAQVDLVPPEKLEMLKAQVPLRRIGRPEEVGAIAVWLASEAAGFVTGTTNDINGGFVMR